MTAPPSAPKVGMAAAGLAALFSIAYVLGQLLEWAGILGSAGGPQSASTPLGIAILLIPSLLLGPSFVVTLAALHVVAPPAGKVFTLSGLAFATAYATLTGLVYFVQLTFVAPRLAVGEAGDIALLLFVPYESFLFAVDLFGYSLMSAASLFTAFGLPDVPAAKWTKVAMLTTGAVLPFLALQMFLPVLIWPASIWGISFPLSAILLVRLFGQVPPDAN